MHEIGNKMNKIH